MRLNSADRKTILSGVALTFRLNVLDQTPSREMYACPRVTEQVLSGGPGQSGKAGTLRFTLAQNLHSAGCEIV
jgi:hypothetical protein